ncbi:hypothetical protein [Bradyrhizobium sp. Bra64]|uniref:hypothetical protein n=1 Tax=Bradyrhizobium sp. Bra64 TaxID=2926009 RepID=UPI0021184CCA|nr:hypothetical protein [Bradyrhizobium sp. Bra64]
MKKACVTALGICAIIFSGTQTIAQNNGAKPKDEPLHNTRGGATEVGRVDVPWKFGPDTKLAMCSLIDLWVRADSPYFDSWYIRYDITDPKTFLNVRMIEHPTDSLWFRLYTADGSFIKEIKGADNEVINEQLGIGTFYVQVVTGTGYAHMPDGTNHARIISRYSPGTIAQPNEPIILNPGSGPVLASYTGSVGTFVGRETAENVAQIAPEVIVQCPVSEREEHTVMKWHDEITIRNVPAGKYTLPLVISNGFNLWPDLAAYYVGNIGDAKIDGTFEHFGGDLKLKIGAFGPVEATSDHYAQYSFQLVKQ